MVCEHSSRVHQQERMQQQQNKNLKPQTRNIHKQNEKSIPIQLYRTA